jgi:CBS-domain-containing membrane protein
MNKTAKDLVQGQDLAWVRPDDLVDQAFQKMARWNVSSLPVIDAPTGSATPSASNLKGFVDLVDLVAFLSTVGTRIMTNPYGVGESRNLATDDVAILHRRSKEWRVTNTIDVSNFGKRNPLHKINQNMSVKDLVNFFGKFNEAVHRVAVVDDNHNLIGVLTQSMLLRCVNEDLGRFPEANNIKARSLRMTQANKLATVRSDLAAFEAFMKMHNECLSSLAVVSDSGDICENISATDLKGALTDFKRLLLPVREYLGETRSVVLGMKKPEGLVHCYLDSTLRDVVGLFNDSRMHRVYVVDEQRKPVGVVSLTDIFHNLTTLMA